MTALSLQGTQCFPPTSWATARTKLRRDDKSSFWLASCANVSGDEKKLERAGNLDSQDKKAGLPLGARARSCRKLRCRPSVGCSVVFINREAPHHSAKIVKSFLWAPRINSSRLLRRGSCCYNLGYKLHNLELTLG